MSFEAAARRLLPPGVAVTSQLPTGCDRIVGGKYPAGAGLRNQICVMMSSTEVLGVLRLVFLPFFRQIVGSKDCRHRTHRNAGAAVNTLDGIDEQLVSIGKLFRILLRMNAIHWARVHTRGVLGANARFCNYVCHFFNLSNDCGPRKRSYEAAPGNFVENLLF